MARNDPSTGSTDPLSPELAAKRRDYLLSAFKELTGTSASTLGSTADDADAADLVAGLQSHGLLHQALKAATHRVSALGGIETSGAEKLAGALNDLATIQQHLGELPAAKANMERAIAIEEKHFDPDHPTLAVSYSNLALIQKDLGELPAAKENTQRAIAIDEKHFDPDHPILAIRYSNLGMIQKDLGELAEAKANIERSIAINQKHFNPDHPSLATNWHNLAGIVCDEGDAAGAAELEQKALDILLKHFTEEHPHVRISRRSLAHYRAAVT